MPPTVYALLSCALLTTIPTSAAAICGPVATGTYSTGFDCAPAIGVVADLETSPGTEITTSLGPALRTASRNADSTILLRRTKITSNVTVLANGIHAQVTGGLGNSAILFSSALNSVDMGTVGDNAVFVQNNTAGLSSVVVNAGARLDITNDNTTGIERDGIEINSIGTGDATLLFNGSGTISTANGNGLFIKAQGGGDINMVVSSDVSISVEKPAATANYAGIHTRTLGLSDTMITSGATIDSSGPNAYGIYTQAVDGVTVVNNTGDITTDGLNGFGIRSATSGLGDIDVDNAGNITTTGTMAHGIYLTSPTGDITLSNDGALTVGANSATLGSRAVYVNAVGDVVITGTGDITVRGTVNTIGGYGIIANSNLGDMRVDYSGALTIRGTNAAGIRVDAMTGDVIVNYTGTGIETFNANGIGIYASSRSATATVDVFALGTIITHANDGSGDGTADGAFGLEAISYGGDINVVYNGSRIDVNGDGAAILAANAYFTGTGLGTITVFNSGNLTTRGDEQQGIRTYSTTGEQTITNTGVIRTFGATDSQGIWALTNGDAPLSILNTGDIKTIGDNSSAIDAISEGGRSTVTNTGTIDAGWNTSAGVLLGGATQELNNAGTIKALSDVAVRADAENFAGTLDIDNRGTLTGVVTASTSKVQFDNFGTWALRNFADTDGSGTRDTLAVAISLFGTSGLNRIDNRGILSLLGDDGAATDLDSSGVYNPFGLQSTNMKIGGAVQGQILGVATFTNSGLIDLTANKAAGDVLVISGGDTAGTDGGGVFQTDGGVIRFNTVLNAGDRKTQSDILVVDATIMGSGSTILDVRNLNGNGALTLKNGIPLVEVLNKNESADDAFVLNGDFVTKKGEQAIVGGAYAYMLHHGGVKQDKDDGNWYLRSFLKPDGPPNYNPGVPTYEAYQQILLALNMLPTLQQRVGNRYWSGDGASLQQPGSATYIDGTGMWTRVVGAKGYFEPSQSTSGSRFDLGISQLQAGIDTIISENDKGVVIGGLTFTYGHGSGDVKSLHGDGDISTTSYGLGGTLTWYGNNGFYVDGQAQVSWLTSDLASTLAGRNLINGNDAFGYAFSVETGRRFAIDSRWSVTPQAQLIYSGASFETFDDVFDARIRNDGADSLIGRLGLAVDRETSWLDDNGRTRRLHAYGIVNVNYEFLDGSSVKVSGTRFHTEIDRMWTGIGLGGTYNWNDDKYSLYGEVSANTSLKDFGDSYVLKGTVGARLKF